MKRKFLKIYIFTIILIVCFSNNVYALYNEAKEKSDHRIQFLIDKLSTEIPRHERNAAGRELLEIGDPAIPLLIKSLETDDWMKQYCIIQTLTYLEAKESVPHLIPLLNSEKKEIAISVAIAIGQIGDKRGFEPLHDVLKETNDTHRKSAIIIGLGLMGDKRAIPILKKELKESKNIIIQIHAAGSLGRLGNKEGFSTVLKYLKSKDIEEKTNAIQAIGIIGDKQAVPILEEILTDPNEKYKSQVLLSLKQIEFKNLTEEEKVPFLADCLKNKESMIKIWAVKELGKDGSPQAIEELKKSTEDKKIKELAILELRKKKISIKKDFQK
ncbi:MAG: HEAT repeat domain-containing protein [bacterium]|nr:HEAT repeat domain-containing protein [bacterium]